MKKYALLVLRDGGNRVIHEVTAHSYKAAVVYFNAVMSIVLLCGKSSNLQLGENGYFKDGPITYTIAEYAFNT